MLDRVEHLLSCKGVEAGGGLVEEEELRVGEQLTCMYVCMCTCHVRVCVMRSSHV